MKKLIAILFISLFITFQLFSQSYNWDWYQTISSTNLDQGGTIKSIVLDDNNNIYYTGFTYDTAYTDTNMIDNNGASSAFLVKYDENGNYIWSKTFGGLNDENAFGIIIDNKNNIFVTGQAIGLVTFDGIVWENLSSCNRAYIVKFDEDGNYLWHTIPASDNSQGYCLDSDSINNLYFTCTTGMFVDSFETQPLITGNASSIIAKYDNQNSFEWMRQIRYLFKPQLSHENNYIYLIGCGLLGYDIIYNIDTIIPDNDYQWFIFKFDESGNLIWYKKTYGYSMSQITSNNNHFYIKGNLKDTLILPPNDTLISISVSNGFIASFDTSGNVEWAHVADGNNSRIPGVDFDSQNNLWVLCNYRAYLNIGQINLVSGFNPKPLIFQISENGIVNNNNYFEWFAPTCGMYSEDLKLDSYENFIVNGFFYDCFEAGIFYTISSGNYDLFLTKLSLVTENNNLEISNNNISIYPNPTTGVFTIKAEEVESIEVINIQGKQIYKGKETEIDLSTQPKGIYIIKVITDKQTITQKLIKQ